MYRFVFIGITILLLLGSFAMTIGRPLVTALLGGILPKVVFALYPTSEHALKLGEYYFNIAGAGSYNLPKAEEYFKKAIELNDDNASALYQLARVEFAKGELDKSLMSVNEAISQNPTFLKAYYIRALANGFKKNFEQAQQDFEYILANDKESKGLWAVYNDLAWLKFQQGDYKGVEEITQKGLTLFPRNPWLLNSLGTAYLNTQQKGRAKALFEQALSGANKLTSEDWQQAYSANDPESAPQGLKRIRNMIQFNLGLSES